MKKYLIGLFVLLIVIIISCEQSKESVEIIPSYYKEYNSNQMFGVFHAVFADSTYETKLENDIVKLVKSIEPNAGDEATMFSIEYEVYISETGNVDKIKNATTVRSYMNMLNSSSKLNFYDDDVKMDKAFANLVKDWKLKPAVLNGKKVKSVERFGAYVKFYSKDSVETTIDPRLKYLSESERKFYYAVEQMPEPIGGIAGIQKKITYPEIARRAGIQGRVFIKAFIDENGDVAKTEVIKGIGAGCDEAAEAAVMQTKFLPGKQEGKPVKVQVSVPILFKIQ